MMDIKLMRQQVYIEQNNGFFNLSVLKYSDEKQCSCYMSF